MDKENYNQSERALREEQILEFWNAEQIFKKTLEKESPKGEFVFYEGPPTANGRPGIHHVEARSFKDIIPRYKTMQGFHVRRKAGWDTHGLPVEIEAEKQLGLKSKKEIEEYGVAEFNKKCKESVWKYVDEWRSFTERIGYWVDLDDPYVTYDPKYMESLWAVFKKVADRGLLYKDYRIVPWCPRCGTGLSSHELAQGYKDVKDLSVTAKFKVKGQENTYILAWTTTPWTLPGNVALAVGEDITYVKFSRKEDPDTFFIASKDFFNKISGGNFDFSEGIEKLSNEAAPMLNEKVISVFKGKDLVGLEYEPLYPYLQNKFAEQETEGAEKAFKVYAADFVTTEDGTGVVHTAVMYGQDDFDLGTELGLPKLHMVNAEGYFIDGTDFLESRFAKDEEVAIDIIKDLANRPSGSLLFDKKKYEHSYPHCWRCKTPLIYYARDSWYIRMSELREELLAQNENINWEPAHIKPGRFGEWLKDVKDWAISRERYWGTPLPVWQAGDGEQLVIGSVADIAQYAQPAANKYWFVRHGRSHNNVAEIANCTPEDDQGLTEEGEENARDAAKDLADAGITKIFSSPMPRALQTAQIIARELGLGEDAVVAEPALTEIDFGDFNGKHIGDWIEHRQQYAQFSGALGGGESHRDVAVRVGQCIEKLEKEFAGETILLAGHGAIGEGLLALQNFSSDGDAWSLMAKHRIENGVPMEFTWTNLPHNDRFELDLHKPYIDDVVLQKDGKTFTRTPEVMDVWFDSGAMPFAQDHYPFQNKEWVDGPGFPADFISEAIDQTRGWFYTLHAVGTLMGKGNAYKNVICLGHILDAEGKKMSKSVGNVVNPWEMIAKHGVDTLRLWMYSVNQPGDSKNFDEKTVEELGRKVFTMLENIVAFYEMYSNSNEYTIDPYDSPNVLDTWMLSLKDQLVQTVVENLDSYNVLVPARAIRDFIGEMSQWYIRRSRDRFKSEDENDRLFALATTQRVLSDLAKVMAPFAPFFAEWLFQRATAENLESVHLAQFPEVKSFDREVLDTMAQVRDIVSAGLEARQKAGVKVRQPLQSMTITQEIPEQYHGLILDEMNIKEIHVGDALGVDVTITPELAQEGDFRELLRAVQGLRKEHDLEPTQYVVLQIKTDDAGRGLVEKFREEFQQTAQIENIDFAESVSGKEVVGQTTSFTIAISQ